MCSYLSYLRQEPVRPERSHCKKDLKICCAFCAYTLGTKVIDMRLPNDCNPPSTVANGSSRLAALFKISIPISLCWFSRPWNTTTKRTWFFLRKNSSIWRIFTSKSCDAMCDLIRNSFKVTLVCFFFASAAFLFCSKTYLL